MASNTPRLSKRPAWSRKALILTPALSVLLVVGVLAASCGGSTGGATTTASGPKTTHVTAPSTTAGPATTTAGGAQVVIKSTAFDPATVTIKVGESVTWTNQDPINHTVVADNGEFKSGELANGDTFSFTFDKAGTYAYHCSIHPSMKATVVVE
jgi:plastocyanin